MLATSNAVIVYTATPESDLVDHVRHVCPGLVVVWPVAPAAGIHAARHLASAVVSAPTDLDDLPLPTLRCPRGVRSHAREWLDRQVGRGIRPVAIDPPGDLQEASARDLVHERLRAAAQQVTCQGPKRCVPTLSYCSVAV